MKLHSKTGFKEDQETDNKNERVMNEEIYQLQNLSEVGINHYV